ncbi:MAG: hypothetical protein JO154_10810 [Chitinophaga sp.]|uniref:hypothetical protein n=1 Tax=Chitinophaga sp. TaxID=1869181 RepID=UPI0025C63A43|nr:hypothetical protein [Chitinophaga sp.]MBV8253087.1 hypothetical protein [Chitinophaga sp.]
MVKKKSSPAGEGTNGNDTTKITTPADPAVAATTGFFLDSWKPLVFTAPASKPGSPPNTANVNISIDAGTVISRIAEWIHTRTIMGFSKSKLGVYFQKRLQIPVAVSFRESLERMVDNEEQLE